LPKPSVKVPVQAVQDDVPAPLAKKKDDLELNWINMQATVNDSLKRDLESLSEKYERLAQKEEKRKKEKKKAQAPPSQKAPPTVKIPPQIPPQYQQPIPQQQPRQVEQRVPAPYGTMPYPTSNYTIMPRQLRPGQYQRGRPMSINQF
jgi:hypothetical protein